MTTHAPVVRPSRAGGAAPTSALAGAPTAAPTAAPTSTRPAALPSLTGLRWIAATAVFVFHVYNARYLGGAAQTALGGVMGAGAVGVSLFFVLSGFVLAWSATPGQSAPAFWRRRIARVYPLHLVGVVAATALSLTLVPGIATPDPAALVANLGLISAWNTGWWQAGNPVSWSLVCEAFFYLCFPLLFAAARRLTAEALWVGALLCVVLTCAAPLTAPALTAATSPLLRLPEFVLGVVVARLLHTGAWRGAALRVAIPVATAGYVAATIFVRTPWATSAWTLVGFALLVSALARADIEGRATGLQSRTMVRLGERSFAFYLVHLLVIQTFAAAWPGGWPQLDIIPAVALMTSALVVSVLFAVVLHRVVEVPARRLLLRGRSSRPHSVSL